MPVTISAQRALRKDRKRNLVNNKIRVKLRHIIKHYKLDPSNNDLSQVYSVIDRAAKKNIIHKNKAARIKSQLSTLEPVTEKSTKKTPEKISKKPSKSTKKSPKKSTTTTKK